MADDATHPTAPDSAAEADAASTARNGARKTWLVRLAIAVAVIAGVWGLWYFLVAQNYVSTENAYVNGETAQVTPLISGAVIELRVKDTQTVKQGDVLAVLDSANARITLAQAEAELAAARRRFRQTQATGGALSAQIAVGSADVARARAQLTSAQADLAKAEIDLQRRQALSASGAVSGEELTSARRTYAAAQAAVTQARAAVQQAQAGQQAAQGQYAANDALVSGSSVDSDPSVLAAQAKVDAARLDVERTVVRAPIAGVITRRQVQLGQRVAAGTSIMMIVPVGQLYIDANFKERQLRGVKIGMPAKVTADIYGSDVVYHGRVAGLSGGTGASMSLIPAQNATGNWIKVVQRLPVRIELDPKELAAHPLRVGLSTEVEIDLGAK